MNYAIEHKNGTTTIYKTLKEAKANLLVSDKCISLTQEKAIEIDTVRQNTSNDW